MDINVVTGGSLAPSRDWLAVSPDVSPCPNRMLETSSPRTPTTRRKKPTGIAADSKGIAEHANDLAGKANEIAADANAISQRALAVTADQTVYKWRVEYDGETSTVFLVNDCGNIARDVHVFVRFEDQTIAQARVDKTMPFCEIALESEFFSKQIIKDRSEIDAINSGNGFFFADIGTCRVTVHVTYTTELGSDATLRSSSA